MKKLSIMFLATLSLSCFAKGPFVVKACWTDSSGRFTKAMVQELAQEKADFKCMRKGKEQAVHVGSLPHWDNIGCVKSLFKCE